MKIPLRKLDPELPTPRRAHAGDAGVDLHAREDTVLTAGEWAAVPTGVAVAIPEGFVGLVAPRSGLAVSSAISVVNGPGVIDSGYRGELKAVLINHSTGTVTFRRGDRIAQLLVLPAPEWSLEVVDDLDTSSRGEQGFGSTGA
jgi:dUTP pyrophosphatase